MLAVIQALASKLASDNLLECLSFPNMHLAHLS